MLQTGERGGTNTDTIIVLHTGSGGRTMMSIPRDTLVEVPDGGTQMINAAFASGGAPLLVQRVEALTGIHIDHYVELGFGSVINTVDAFGGVEICPKQDMKDPMARLDIKKGCQEVDGLTALAYSRSRHVTALSDLDRVARQREVISALGDEALSPWTFVNPVRYWRINDAATGAIRIDEEMNPFDLGRFALAMTGESQTCTMPNLPAPSDPNRIVADPDRAPALFDAIIDDSTVPRKACTPTGAPARRRRRQLPSPRFGRARGASYSPPLPAPQHLQPLPHEHMFDRTEHVAPPRSPPSRRPRLRRARRSCWGWRTEALRARRLAEVAELRLAIEWAVVNGHPRDDRDPMVTPGGDGTPRCASTRSPSWRWRARPIPRRRGR